MDQGRDRKWASKIKWTEREYNIQDIKDVPHKSVKISCDTTQFPVLPFCGPHRKPYRARELIEN